MNLHSSYKVTENVEVFGLVRNLFDQHYSVYGTFFDVTSFPYLNLTDPRTFVPGMPFAAYVGVRGTIPTGGPAFGPMPRRRLSTKTSPVAWTEATSPVVSWTGIYLGLNGGFTFGGSNWTDSVTGGSTGNFGTSGFVFGGTVGANYQVGSLVFGVEADGDWADASGFGTFTASALCAGGCLTTSSWLSTVRGRAGYAFDRFLVYGTGGAAFGNVRANFSNDPVSSSIEAGWTVGAGVEVAFGTQLERQGGIPFRQPRRRVMHHELRYRRCKRNTRHSQRSRQIQRERRPRRHQLQIQLVIRLGPLLANRRHAELSNECLVLRVNRAGGGIAKAMRLTLAV